MFKKVLFFIIFILAVTVLFYFAYNDPSGIAFSLFGYVFETSLYLIGAVLLVVFKIVSYLSSIFSVVKSIISFFTGRSKERAEKALLNAYAAALSGRPVQARKYLKRSEKFYQDNPHPAFIKLITDRAIGNKDLAVDALSKVEKSADIKTLTPYVRALYENDQESQLRYVKDAGSYKENKVDLEKYVALALKNNAYDEAKKALKNGQPLLDNGPQHLAAIHILQAHKSALSKDPESSLSHAQSAMKQSDNVIAFLLAQNAFKKLMRENKSTRLIHDRFRTKPDFTAVKAFLDIRSQEEEEKMAKRISALPRETEKENAFLALQAYHFAKYRDFQSLAVAVRYVEEDHENDWVDIALLCMAMEKDEMLYEQALTLFLNVIAAKAYEELCAAVDNLPDLYYTELQDVIAPYHAKSLDVVRNQVSLFQNMVKHIPLTGHYKGGFGSTAKISQDDVKQLYNGSFKDEDDEA